MSGISKIYDVQIEDVFIGSHNVRLEGAERNLEELADSIKLHGLMQPIVLCGVFGEPKYEIISGQRRYLAHERLLKTATIKAVFVGNLTPTEMLIRSLAENMQRTDLSFTDTAKAVTKLYEEFGDEYKVKEATGLSIKRIRDHLLIDARASPKMKDLIAEGKISVVDVKRALQAAQDDMTKAQELINMIIENNPTPQQKKRLVVYGNRDPRMGSAEVYQEAVKPQIERRLVVSLTPQTRSALQLAVSGMQMDVEDITERALSEWLTAEGFVASE